MNLFSFLKPKHNPPKDCLIECVAFRDLQIAKAKLTANSTRWCEIVQFWYQSGSEIKGHAIVAWQFGSKLMIYDPDMNNGKGGSIQVARDADTFSPPTAWQAVRFFTKLPVTRAEFFTEEDK